MSTIRVINFAFAFTGEQKAELAAIVGVSEGDLDITEVKTNFTLPTSYVGDQVKALVESANVPRGGTPRLIVNLPGMSWAAVAVLSAIQGFYGSLPEIMRLTQDQNKVFHVQEVIHLQSLRDDGRKARYDGREGKTFEQRVVVNFSHPLTEEQLGKFWFTPEIIAVPTQVDVKSNFAETAVKLVDAVGLSSEQWQKADQIFVNVPALAPLAAAVLTEINARMGTFPRIIRLDRQPDNSFVHAETMTVQDFREWAFGYDAAKAEEARRQQIAMYVATNPMSFLDQKTGELVMVAGGKTFRFKIAEAVVEDEVSYQTAQALTNNWMAAHKESAKANQVQFYPPGVGNGLIYGFFADALRMGALTFGSAPAVLPQPAEKTEKAES